MARTVRGSRGFDTYGAHDVGTTVTAQSTGGNRMAERITNAQFANRCNWATQTGRACGALNEGEWIGTAVAWSMSYVCIFDANGTMVRSMSNPMTRRGLFDYVSALGDAFTLTSANTGIVLN
jgi:hypothetical protein